MAFGLVYFMLEYVRFLLLYSSRRSQIINARYKDIEGFKLEFTDIKGFSYKHPKVNDFL